MSEVNVWGPVTITARGHKMTLDPATLPENAKRRAVEYAIQRLTNDPLGRLGKGFKADSDENRAKIESVINKQWAELLAGQIKATRASGPRTSDPVEREFKSIVAKRVAAFVSANWNELAKMHNVANPTAFKKAGLEKSYGDRIAAKYQGEIQREAEANVRKLTKSAASTGTEGDMLAV